MALPGYKNFEGEDWIDPTPLPKEIPPVDEVGSTGAPLKSASFFIGTHCKEYNEDFMLCKDETRDPKHCLLEGRKVTRCAVDALQKIQSQCLGEFRAHWNCLDYKNQEFGRCREQEKPLNDCLFKAFGWKKSVPGAPANKPQIHERANQSAKRIVQENAARISVLQKVYIGVNLVYIVVRFLLQYTSLGWKEFLMYAATFGLETFIYVNLYQVSRPRYDPGGILVDAGTDLSQPGLVSYMFDYLYVSWFVHLLSLVTRWAWLLYLAIPIYLVVTFGPYLRQFIPSLAGQQGGGGGDEAQLSEKEKKKREKKERKKQQPRVKYVN
ncbi:ndufa8, NADH-ubiquinone oxidoreductase complex I 19kd subunit [Coemansia sp. RSA 1200]|nr:ndufa8, NADH-ubiquinone oxidoreductase complex I 19kd subunit [Coemansia sp. RSA 1200]